jgi:hypothetical protein
MAVVTAAGANDTARGDSLRTLCAAAAHGDRVLMPGLPAGQFYDISGNPVTIANKGIQVIGEGALLSQVKATNMAGPAFIVQNDAPPNNDMNWLRLADFRILGNGDGINAGSTTTTSGIELTNVTIGKSISFAEFHRLTVSGCKDGINFDNTVSKLGEHLLIDRCQITTNYRWGISAAFMSQIVLRGCNVNASGNNGIRLIACTNAAIRECSSQGNNKTNATPVPTGEVGAQTLIKLCHAFSVDGLYCESLPTVAGATKTGLAIMTCQTGSVTGYNIQETAFRGGAKGIHLLAASKSIKIDPFPFSFIESPLYIENDCGLPEGDWNFNFQQNP